jgi:hypothetical protein
LKLHVIDINDRCHNRFSNILVGGNLLGCLLGAHVCTLVGCVDVVCALLDETLALGCLFDGTLVVDAQIVGAIVG